MSIQSRVVTEQIPQQGQLVHVRNRPFVVQEISLHTPISKGAGHFVDEKDTVQHLMRLAAVDYDAQGEQLTVIWELETDIEKFHLAILNMREQLRLQPKNIQTMVQTALDLAGQLSTTP